MLGIIFYPWHWGFLTDHFMGAGIGKACELAFFTKVIGGVRINFKFSGGGTGFVVGR